MNHLSELLGKIKARTARIGIVGLGYVGLPLAVEFAEAGLPALGVDVDADKTARINAGSSYIDDVPDARLKPLVASGKLRATTRYDDLRQVDAISICVPTPLRKTGDPDMSYINRAAQSIAQIRRPGMLILLESTTYPGTTEEIILPRIAGDKLTVGEDVFIAYSPERIDPATASSPCATRQKSSAASPTLAARPRRLCTKRLSNRSCRCLRRPPQRWSSCWKTPSAP